MKTFAVFVAILFLLLFGWAVYGEAQTCAAAIKATPMGPFPCSVTITYQDNSTNETGFLIERRLNGGVWTTLGGGPVAANVTSVIDATLQQSTTVDNVYDYKVSAVRGTETVPGVNPVTASFTIPKAVPPLNPPTGITVTFKGANGILDCPTCAGGDKRVPLGADDGTFVITSYASMTVEYH